MNKKKREEALGVNMHLLFRWLGAGFLPFAFCGKIQNSMKVL